MVARSVVVTGGAGGIGRAIATRFAADGARVLLTGRTEETVVRTARVLDATQPGEVIGVVCDSTVPRDVALPVPCCMLDMKYRRVNGESGRSAVPCGLVDISDAAFTQYSLPE